MDRIIGDIVGAESGLTVLIVGGLHGNEPAGVKAAESIIEWLSSRRYLLRGRVVALRGNIGALCKGVRFIDADLNRVWGNDADSLSHELEERNELQRAISQLLSPTSSRIILCDLHTTSGASPPFRWVITESDLQFPLPVPAVFGTTGAVKGTFGEWMARRGATVVCVEGGEHESAESVSNHRRMLFTVLGLTGALSSELDEVVQATKELEMVSSTLPRECTIVAHHQISPKDAFKMRPGFRSFEPVRAGDVLADDLQGEVRAPFTGHLLLPLYQQKGEDGFLIVKEGR